MTYRKKVLLAFIAILTVGIFTWIILASTSKGGKPEEPTETTAAIRVCRSTLLQHNNVIRESAEKFIQNLEKYKDAEDLEKEFARYLAEKRDNFFLEPRPKEERSMHGDSEIYLLPFPRDVPTESYTAVAISQVVKPPSDERPHPHIEDGKDGILWLLKGAELSFIFVDFELFKKHLPELGDAPDIYTFGDVARQKERETENGEEVPHETLKQWWSIWEEE